MRWLTAADARRKNEVPRFLDLFAGAGGLSEGFIQAGYVPVAHVDSDQAACFTLRTRMAYHWLKSNGRTDLYADYLNGTLNRKAFYAEVPSEVISSVIHAEIGDVTLPDIFRRVDDLVGDRGLDVIVGGPPCQAYSVIGRSRVGKEMKSDKRNYLYSYYAEFLKRYAPRFFVFENVIGLLSAKNEDNSHYFDAMKRLFRQFGYESESRTLSAENYGVLQRRRRIILVGRRGKDTGFYPEPDKSNPDVCVKEVFVDLPALAAGEGSTGPCDIEQYCGSWQLDANVRNEALPVTWHQARPHTDHDLEIYRIAVDLWDKKQIRLKYNLLEDRLKTHKNLSSFLDRFKVVASNLPYSQAVLAHIAKDGHYYIHPDRDQNRSITPREAARLQTFPDDYFFESSISEPRRTPAFRQIGNAVPVLLARRVADKLKEALS